MLAPAVLAGPVTARIVSFSDARKEGLRLARHGEAKLMPLIETTKADELMVTTMIFDHAARKRSYELLARAFA